MHAQLGNREMLKFSPPELQKRLAALELEYARSHPPHRRQPPARGPGWVARIANTAFTVPADRDRSRAAVTAQRYREQNNGLVALASRNT